jgi:hypothetical protein
VRGRGIIWGAAIVASVMRFAGFLWPIKPDEAGFTLVARNWDPQPDSMYGTYWVDRPPSLIALVKLSDWIGGALFLRLIAAAGCVLLVLAAAAAARSVVRLGGGGAEATDRTAAWAAVLTAMLVGNMSFEPAAAKGEILGIPLVMGSILLSLKALERRSTWASFGAGLLALLAVGLKQNMVAGLVFGGIVLLGSFFTRRITGREVGRLAAAAVAGAAIPVGATVGWALVAGVHLRTVWYAVYGFRSDAVRVISSVSSESNGSRAWSLLNLLVTSGMLLVVLWFLVNLNHLLRRTPVLTLAVTATVIIDGFGLILGGSYWPAYAFVLIPGVALGLVLVLDLEAARRAEGRSRRGPELATRSLVGVATVATAVSVVGYVTQNTDGTLPPTEVYTGRAIAASAQPVDTLVVYGGRADIQYTSGLPSPYQYLWSLPMRTLDPDLTELESLLEGPDAPTWFVVYAPLDSWGGVAERVLGSVLAQRYVRRDDVCDIGIYVRDDVSRPDLAVDCDKPAF